MDLWASERERIRLKDEKTRLDDWQARITEVEALLEGPMWPEELGSRLERVSVLLLDAVIAKDFGKDTEISREYLADYLERGGPLTGKMRDYIVELLRTVHRSRTPKKDQDSMRRALAFVSSYAGVLGVTEAVNEAATGEKVSPRSIWRILEKCPVNDVPALRAVVADLYKSTTGIADPQRMKRC